MHVYASDPEVTRYTAFGPNTPEQTKGFLQLVSGESSQEDRANYSFALIHKETNKLIGSCGLMRSDMNGRSTASATCYTRIGGGRALRQKRRLR